MATLLDSTMLQKLCTNRMTSESICEIQNNKLELICKKRDTVTVLCSHNW